jgi:membrane-associated phospholipid phosphatase
MLNGVLLKNGILEKLLEFDQWLFLEINSDWTNSFLDSVFPFWRHSDTWLPLYLFLFLFMVMNFGWRALPWMLILGITAGICDQVSSNFVKDFFDRARPCSEPELIGKGRMLLSRCPISGSFTSSHAVNHFGSAMFIYITMKDVFKKAGLLFFAWAATICYGQVYVGVHYPFDVIGGAILGCGIGYLMALIFNGQPWLSYKKMNVDITGQATRAVP